MLFYCSTVKYSWFSLYRFNPNLFSSIEKPCTYPKHIEINWYCIQMYSIYMCDIKFLESPRIEAVSFSTNHSTKLSHKVLRCWKNMSQLWDSMYTAVMLKVFHVNKWTLPVHCPLLGQNNCTLWWKLFYFFWFSYNFLNLEYYLIALYFYPISPILGTELAIIFIVNWSQTKAAIVWR